MKQLSEELHHALTTKSRFLANMSHEVRTPLSGIIGMSRILMDGRLTMDQTECVATIQYCGETLLSVINDVLDYTKLEAAGVTLDTAELSLHQCIEESLYTVLSSAQKKGLELIVDIDQDIPDRILGDMLRLRQVMTNLMNNAVKFTDTGYVMVSLTGTEILGTDEWKFECRIKDTGCGVAPESQGKLFKMFSQVDASTTRKYGGTGIGLALAKKFLEMMQGEINMESSGVPGEGSVFYFSIVATLVPFVPVSPAASLNSPRWLINTTNIFIINQLPLASEVLRKRLLGKGFTSTQLSSSEPQHVFAEIEDFLAKLKLQDNKNVLIFCEVEKLTPGKHYPLLDHTNVALVLMGYMHPKNFAADFPQCEFLRKPIKETAFLRCLKDIYSRFDTKHVQPTMSRIPSNKMTTAQHFPLNILVVEDNDMNQKVVRRIFQHLGYSKTIPIANHGQEALDMIEKNGLPDLILTDLQMPVLDGVQTTKCIRSKYPSGWPYIAAMTADAFPEDRNKCLEAGMNDFLTKPIRVEQVQMTLQKCYLLKQQRQ